jgi:hypothetical protein
MKEDTPLAVFEAPEGAAEGLARWGSIAEPRGAVGHESQFRGEEGDFEVAGFQVTGRFGREVREDLRAGPDPAGRAELAEVFGEQLSGFRGIAPDGGIEEAVFEFRQETRWILHAFWGYGRERLA